MNYQIKLLNKHIFSYKNKLLKLIRVGPRCENLIRKEYNYLTVLCRTKSQNKKTYWLCRCKCGKLHNARADQLKDGSITSCGCRNNEIRSKLTNQRNLKKANEIFERSFEFFVPLEFVGYNAHEQRLVKCKCVCGKYFTETVGKIKNGHRKSCGCKQRELIADSKKLDLVGKKYNLLTVLEPCRLLNGEWGQKCLCECGTICYVRTSYLILGHTKSCGCLKSAGEFKIKQILNLNNINFYSEKTFENCKFPETGYKAKFDFYIIDKNYLIEFDGRQHYEGWSNDIENLEIQEYHDNYKNKWCEEHNIPLIRIPYTKEDTLCLEDLMLETTQFRVV